MLTISTAITISKCALAICENLRTDAAWRNMFKSSATEVLSLDYNKDSEIYVKWPRCQDKNFNIS